MRRFGFVVFLVSFVSAILVLSLPVTVLAADVPLTEDQAIALFYQRNLELIAARYNVDTARAQQVIAAAVPNPVFSVNATGSGLIRRGVHPEMGGTGVRFDIPSRLDQLFETAGKRGLRMESSRIGLQAMENDLGDAVRVFSNAVRHAYYGLFLAQKNVDLARDTLARYNDIVRVNGLRLESGDIAESDFLRVEVERFKAQGDLGQTQHNLSKARNDLAVLLNWPDQAMDFVAQDASLKQEGVDAKLAPETFTAQAIEQRPDLQAARLRVNQAEKDLALARARRIPDVTVSLLVERCPAPNCWPAVDYGAGMGLSVPLPLFYRNQGEITQAEINLSNTNLLVQQIERNIRAEVLEAVVAWRAADAQVRRFEGDILGRVKAVRQAAELAYSKGATNILDFIEAQRSYRGSVLEYQNALYNRAVAYADLVKVLGVERAPSSP